MDHYQITIILAVACAIIEVLTLTFLFVGFSIGLLAVALFQYLYYGLQLGRDLLVFAIVSCLVIIAARLISRKRSDQAHLQGEDVNRY